MLELKLPLLGDVMTEGTLAAWLQPEGAVVPAGAPLYQLETDKVSLTVEAPESGVLERLVSEGETVPVGTVVGRLLEEAGVAAAATPPPTISRTEDDAVRASPAARRLAEQLGIDLAALGSGRRLREADVQAYADAHRGATGVAPPAAPTVAPPAAPTEEIRATPAARALARRLGLELTSIGNGRRLREADVQTYAAAQRVQASTVAQPATLSAEAAPPVPQAGVAAALQGQPLAGRRKVIAERMRSSLQQTAQLTIAMEVDMTEAVRLRTQLKELLPAEQQPTLTDLVLRATTLALHEHPALNATLEDGRLRLHPDVHLGLAVDVSEGLIVPVLRNAAALRLPQLASESRRLAQRARDSQLTLEELQGGTFTITSLGALGVDFFTPIINPPQVAILGIGRLFSKVVLSQEQPQERQSMYLNLSFDHQAVDGAPAARFLQSVKRTLELPAGLLL